MATGIGCSKLALTIALALALGGPSPVGAQTDEAAPARASAWGLLDAVGYGGLGLGIGVIAGAAMPSDDFGPSGPAIVTMAGMTLAGIWVGATIGNRARRAITQDQGITPGHRAAVAAGVLLAGAALGALVAVPLINPEGEGTPLGSDEQTFGLLAIGGVALGALYLAKHWDQLGSRRVDVAPSVRPGGQYSLIVRVRF